MTTLALDIAESLNTAGSPDTAASRAESVVRAHLGSVWRYLRMHGASADEADDLVQECFVLAAQKGALGLEAAATATFLRRSARFLFLRRRREDRRAVLLADAVDELWQRDCAHDGGDALLDALRNCLARLAPRTATAVRRCYGLGGDEPASRAALAAELGMQENGIKTLMQRARQQLRDCLNRRHHDD
ncbi:MAG: hypothetical protein KDC98_16600 [Planctomycetes bacterium]|nr:hypothetical protein [Planctomycetota bacterium]